MNNYILCQCKNDTFDYYICNLCNNLSYYTASLTPTKLYCNNCTFPVCSLCNNELFIGCPTCNMVYYQNNDTLVSNNIYTQNITCDIMTDESPIVTICATCLFTSIDNTYLVLCKTCNILIETVNIEELHENHYIIYDKKIIYAFLFAKNIDINNIYIFNPKKINLFDILKI